ncbi:HNH endonuclease [Chlorobium sp. BLA1]|uniref:HNH endonuclease n=1 Tax=Candidatus Chlorobium masyuteum TaxID=2716876 RepID=UPI0014234DCA|nr:HNH endonuclease [Candidatus Chlorobium masyuteum]NHQ59520.1 HNH endonuclease [Candidatus Chlorobium masyuteum]NTU45182.1 HNH endonuclease [Chlorobiaceae bacterium]
MPLLRSKVLVLNSSYEPLTVCDAQKAVLLLFGGKAVSVTHNPDRVIRTVSTSFPMPSIVRLTVFVRVPYKRIMLNRKNILLRDAYQCQYCGRTDLPLTIDHVVPRSRGGDYSWENLITACRRCNTKKGDKTPREADMQPLKQPIRPNSLMFMQQVTATVSDDWKPYLYMS